MAARAGSEPAILQSKGIHYTNAPPRPISICTGRDIGSRTSGSMLQHNSHSLPAMGCVAQVDQKREHIKKRTTSSIHSTDDRCRFLLLRRWLHSDQFGPTTNLSLLISTIYYHRLLLAHAMTSQTRRQRTAIISVSVCLSVSLCLRLSLCLSRYLSVRLVASIVASEIQNFR